LRTNGTDDQAKITELEKQLADKAKEHEEKFDVIEKEKVEMQDRYVFISIKC
jgi:hypothetical protein